MVDLHLHLDGSLSTEDIVELAGMSGITLPSYDTYELKKLLMVEPDCTNLGEYLEKFDLPGRVLQTKECIELAVYRLLGRLKEQGLCYAEVRFAPQLHLKKGLSQREVTQSAVMGLTRAIKDYGMPANLILCCMRGRENYSENAETVEVAGEFLGKGVCALDLAGNEAAYPTDIFSDIFNMARERHIPAIIHAGEAAGAESIWKALELGAVRIGHGIHAVEDAQLLNELRNRKIVLELCYSSNLQTKAVSSPEEYPLKTFIDAGIMATVNTDNITVSNTTLKNEYILLQNRYGFEEDTMKQLAFNAVDGAFISWKEKTELKERISNQFTSWLS